LTKNFIPDTTIHSDSKNKFIPHAHQNPIVKAAEMMSDKGYEEAYLADAIRTKMKRDQKRFWAGDNISDYVSEEMKHTLIDEATEAFELVLDRLLIDRENDPNSKGTARRLAKMYFNEIMEGRYEPGPDATAFPNDSADRYEGMLVVRSELRSMCSHHHQPVAGVAYMAHSSLTQTTVLKGAFKTDPSVKKEFFDNIKLQQEFAPR
jgi:GTP cyclohydrolase I